MANPVQLPSSRGGFIKLCTLIAVVLGGWVSLLVLLLGLVGIVNFDGGDGQQGGVLAVLLVLVIIPVLFVPLGALTGFVAYRPLNKLWPATPRRHGEGVEE